MAYTTSSKVSSMFRDITFDSDSNTAITTSEVEDLITEIDGEIDSQLYPFYVVPITGAEALKVVGLISKLKVTHIVKTILEQNEQVSSLKQDVQSGNLEARAQKLLDDLIPIKDKRGNLCAAKKVLTDATAKEVPPSGGARFKSSSNADPVFQKGVDTW